MKNCEVLDNLKKMIVGNDKSVLSFMFDIKDCELSIDEISFFLESLSSKLDYSDYYTISGSGGSRMYKPNITSIAFLYIASMGIKIVKTGSKSVTGYSGSTDLFDKINLLNIDINNDKYHFAYYDGYCVSLWKKYKNLLSINKSFKDFFDLYVFHDFKWKSKFSIQLNKTSANNYLNKFSYRRPDDLYVVYSTNNFPNIDEIICGDVYVNDFKVYSAGEIINDCVLNNVDDINRLNIDLIRGINSSNYWYNSLMLEVAVFLFVNKLVCSIEEGKRKFEELFNDKSVVRMFSYCNVEF